MRILVVTAHPQYAGMFCAGTLYNHTQRGDEVYAVSLTAGDLMTNRVSRQELARINKRDMENAASLLGFKEARVLGFQDGEVANDLEVRVALNKTIRELKPDIALTHWFHNSTLPDFKATGEATVDALFCARLVSGRWAEKLSSHLTSKAYAFEDPGLSVGFDPNVFVDISGVIDTKIKAIDCFQIHCDGEYGGDSDKFHSSVLGPNRYWGIQSGVMYAEPYMQLKIHEVHSKAVDYLLP